MDSFIADRSGKYAVKVFWAAAWRYVIIDDLLPVSSGGAPLFPLSTAPREIWPALLYKAWLKVTAGCAVFGVPVFLD